jgi:hypothetical protein
MELLKTLLRELQDIVIRETYQLDRDIKDPHTRGYREGARDIADYAAAGIEEALEEMEE